MIYPQMRNFKHESKRERIIRERVTAGLCSELHLSANTVQTNNLSVTSASVAPEDYARIVSHLQSAVCLNVARRVACPAHDSKLWTDGEKKKYPILRFLWKVIVVIMSILYVLLPPYPPKLFRKIVFCCPQKGRYYYLIAAKGATRRACFRASEADGYDHLSICLPQMIRPKVRAIDVFYHLLRCKVFTLPYNEKHKICAMELVCEQSIRWLHRDKNRKNRLRSPNLIIFSQPNSSDLGCCLMMDPNFADIADFLQCDLLIFDYPGYGVSEGTTNEQNVYAAIESVMKYAMDQLGYPAEKIILIGFSLGTAAMVHVAEMYKVAALVLIAPFTSFFRIVCRRPSVVRPWFDMFPSLEKSRKVTSPTLICHGEKDYIVGHEHGVQLKDTIPDCELHLLKHASHQGIFCEREMWDRVEQFLGTRVGITRNWIEHLQSESSTSPAEISEVIENPVSSRTVERVTGDPKFHGKSINLENGIGLN
ncbi:hypothetical protein CRE_03721 [Caenorhabditis remanei]|uniref:AB hydrolase-1 domain-containing protein n=1 Tax=Caenorhabditis remanei TaxID=31234 RepID=E3LXW4_CAERE|nr:hypothetical protein CRE_03721 [Caenorhabditis remanei]